MDELNKMVEEFIKRWIIVKVQDESLDEPLKLLLQNCASDMRADLEAIIEQVRKDYLVNQSDNYIELLMAVENKYPNESRHETALRYIKEAQKQTVGVKMGNG